MNTPTSELAWVLADYEAAGIEPPARCRSNPESTEGEMMSEEEVAEFVKDSIATLRILSDKQSDRFEKVAATFKADVEYLAACGSLDQDEADALIADSNLRF